MTTTATENGLQHALRSDNCSDQIEELNTHVHRAWEKLQQSGFQVANSAGELVHKGRANAPEATIWVSRNYCGGEWEIHVWHRNGRGRPNQDRVRIRVTPKLLRENPEHLDGIVSYIQSRVLDQRRQYTGAGVRP